MQYPNLLSRILLSYKFKQQYVIPEEPYRILEWFLKNYERRVLKVDTSGINIDRPIFMIALPRAGASYLQNIICVHPEVSYITNIMHVFRRCFCAAEHLRKKYNINATGERYISDSVEVDLATPADGLGFWFEWLKEDPNSPEYVERRIEDFSPEEIENIKETIRKMIHCFGGRAGRFFCKNPMLIPHMLLLKDLFPDAKFVHVVRDPRNAANSLVKLHRLENRELGRLHRKKRHMLDFDKPLFVYPRLPNLAENVEKYGAEDVRTTAHLWNDAVTFVNRNKDKLPTFHEVRHEDILADPRKEVLGILEFCELPEPDKDNTKFWERVGEFGVIRHKNVYGEFDVVESICRDNMQQYGYS
ncbi:MAG: sulfotransferase family protein [Planctomycetota bacterium]